MKRNILFPLFLLPVLVYSQRTLPVEPAGDKLLQLYLNMQVEKLWLNGTHVNWQTGAPDIPDATTENTTHCSAFVAAACERVGVYILRPPEHEQELLANAQYDWLLSPDGVAAGWRQINSNVYEKAQNAANKGYMVVAAYRNRNLKRPGHIVCVVPAVVSTDSLAAHGPMVMQASRENGLFTFRKAFKNVIKCWPTTNIAFFYNLKKIE